MKRAWWKEAVIYQIYPRSFMDSNGDGIGDINGIRSKLDYLKDLGVDVVWLSPVYQSPNDDNGYDISDYRNIMDEFGTMEDWENLLNEMHQRGIKLIMDLVVNHTSDEHPWFIEASSSKESPYRDYYIWRDGKGEQAPNNWQSMFSFSAWQYESTTEQYYLHLFTKKQPDLNWENPQVRNEVFDLMRFWLDKGIDGFRMDVINLIGKPDSFDDSQEVYHPNDEKTHAYLQEMNEKVLSHYDIMTVGETPDVTPQTASLFTADSRHELNMVFQFEHMNEPSAEDGTKWTDKKSDLSSLKKVLSKWQKEIEEDAWNSLYLNNHDQPRMVSRFGNDGKYYEKSAKMLATMLHTLKGTPYIYQGEELGMTNVPFVSLDEFRDVETLNFVKKQEQTDGKTFEELLPILLNKSRDHARTPMQWNSDKHSGFTTGTPWIKVNPNYIDINAAKEEKEPNSILQYYKQLIRNRKQYPVIVYGDYQEYLEDDPSVYIYTRSLDGQKILILLNLTEQEIQIHLPNTALPVNSELLISNYNNHPVLTSTLCLQPYESSVFLGEIA